MKAQTKAGKDKERITVEISKETFEKLKKEAEENDLTITGIVKMIFSNYFKSKEKEETS